MITQNLQCSRCLFTYQVYQDMQPIASRCPQCSATNGVLWNKKKYDTYPLGNCEPHLDGEDSYDWEWAKYGKGRRFGEGADESMGQDNR